MDIGGPFQTNPFYEYSKEEREEEHEEDLKKELKEEEGTSTKEESRPHHKLQKEDEENDLKIKHKEKDKELKKEDSHKKASINLTPFEEAIEIAEKEHNTYEENAILQEEDDTHERVRLKAIRDQEFKGGTFRG